VKQAAKEVGLPKHYNATNPAKWMATSTDVFELVNFFEAQNTSYEVDSQAHTKGKKAEAAAPAAKVG
jgi:ribonucleoside-diphosphate reductase beta chain